MAELGSGATDALARFVVETGYHDLPRAAVEAAKVAILDGVANLLAGCSQPVARIVGPYVREMGGVPESTVAGWGYRTSPPQAAFANASSCTAWTSRSRGTPPRTARR